MPCIDERGVSWGDVLEATSAHLSADRRRRISLPAADPAAHRRRRLALSAAAGATESEPALPARIRRAGNPRLRPPPTGAAAAAALVRTSEARGAGRDRVAAAPRPARLREIPLGWPTSAPQRESCPGCATSYAARRVGSQLGRDLDANPTFSTRRHY